MAELRDVLQDVISISAHKIICAGADDSFRQKFIEIDGLVRWSQVIELHNQIFPSPNTVGGIITKGAILNAALYDGVGDQVMAVLPPPACLPQPLAGAGLAL